MNEIWAAIIGAVLTAILGAAWYLYRSHRGNLVLVEKIAQSSQISLKPSVEKDLEVNFKGKKVSDIVLTQFSIKNSGDIVIKPLILNFKLKCAREDYELFNLSTDDPLEMTDFYIRVQTNGVVENEEIVIERDFLNPIKSYKNEKITLSILSDKPLDLELQGGGENWGSKLVNQTEPLKETRFMMIVSFLLAISLIITYVISDITGKGETIHFRYFDIGLLAGLVAISVNFFPLFFRYLRLNRKK